MTTIAVSGVPPLFSISRIMKLLVKAIKGDFEPLNFCPSRTSPFKIFYFKLSKNVDPMQCLIRINSTRFSSYHFKAYIPRNVPSLQVSKNPRVLPKKLRKKFNIKKAGKVMTLEKKLYMSRNDIMYELQHKFTALPDINERTKKKLYAVLAQKIDERLAAVVSMEKEEISCSYLSLAYRRNHPHKNDFAFIEECLQLAGGIGETLTEEMLKPHPPTYTAFLIDNLPRKKMNAAVASYSTLIIDKITAHICAMNTYLDPTKQNPEEASLIQVRQQLQKMQPYIPAIVKEILENHFIPKKDDCIMRIYGEPRLPSKAVITEFLNKWRVVKVYRSQHSVNCLNFQVPRHHVTSVLASDACVLSGCKLIIRLNHRDMMRDMINEINASYSGKFSAEVMTSDDREDEADQMDEDQPDNEEDWEQWDEEM